MAISGLPMMTMASTSMTVFIYIITTIKIT